MRDYGKVYATFWSSQTTHTLSDDGKLLALYLMTCSHNTIAGVFRLPDGYVAEDIGWDNGRVRKGFKELLTKCFANRCETTKWVWVVKHLDWNKPENPNQRKSAAMIAQSLPDECRWKQAFMRDCWELLDLPEPEKLNPSETVPEPLLNQEQEQEQEKETCASGESRVADLPAKKAERERVTAELFAEFWTAYPRKRAKDEALKAFARRKPDRDLLGAMLAALAKQSASEDWQRDEGKFIPYPATWINGGRWLDEVHGQAVDDRFFGAI
jgi:hypothetical protein